MIGTPPGRRNPQFLGFHTYLSKHKRCGRLWDYYVAAARKNHDVCGTHGNRHLLSILEQWTVIRMAIAKNRDIAELMTAGLRGERGVDAADQLRLEQMLQENLWASFHIWERTQRGIFPKGTFELAVGPHLIGLIGTERGGAWWQSAKHIGFIPGFVADVDAVLAKGNPA